MGGHGGGILNNGSLTILDVTISGNAATGDGGGVFNGSLGSVFDLRRATLTVVDSTISGNSAGDDGGGLFNGVMPQASGPPNSGTATVNLTDSIVVGNSAGGDGGGLSNRDSCELIVTNCQIQGNSAQYYGGGIYSYRGRTTLVNSLVVGNAAADGDGVYTCAYQTYTVSIPPSYPDEYAELFRPGHLVVANSTVTGNDGTGIRSTKVGTGSITIGGGGKTFVFSDSADVANSIVAGNGSTNLSGTFATNVGNLVGGDPQFVRDPSDGGDGWGDNPSTPSVDESLNDDYGDLHLLSVSPAVNAGDNAMALDAEGNPLATDLDGNPRIRFGRVDAGAYEFWQVLTPAETVPGDASLDGVVDEADAAILAAHWGLGTAEWEDGDFTGDGKVGPVDAALLTANWGAFYTPPRPASAPEMLPAPAPVGPPLIGPLRPMSCGLGRQLIEPVRATLVSPLATRATSGLVDSGKADCTASQSRRDDSLGTVKTPLTPQAVAAACDAALAEEFGPRVGRSTLPSPLPALSNSMARRGISSRSDRLSSIAVSAVDLLFAVARS